MYDFKFCAFCAFLWLNTGQRHDYPLAIHLRRYPRGWGGDMDRPALSSRSRIRVECGNNSRDMGR